MNKSNSYSGQPIFNQVLHLIPRELIRDVEARYSSDRYYKRFKSWEHLVSMLYASINRLSSIRELTTGLEAWKLRLGHLGMRYFPKRSTVSDANKTRSEAFFRDVYSGLYARYYGSFPDSRKVKRLEDRLFLMDSTTMDLFREIMQGVGRKPSSGKRKGGVKAHFLLNAAEDVPQLVTITPARKNDRIFMKEVDLPAGSILVFDKGYGHYGQWEDWGRQGIFWVTRAMKNASFKVIEVREVGIDCKIAGVVSDSMIKLGDPNNPNTTVIKARRVEFYDKMSGKTFCFLTNHTKFSPRKIAMIYKKRWQIECFFKRLKQNYPLRNFLGDNENAIRIQIWCSLIADLLVKVIKEKVTIRKWSYSNLSSFLRLHLGTYIEMRAFLDNPETAIRSPANKFAELPLYPT